MTCVCVCACFLGTNDTIMVETQDFRLLKLYIRDSSLRSSLYTRLSHYIKNGVGELPEGSKQSCVLSIAMYIFDLRL